VSQSEGPLVLEVEFGDDTFADIRRIRKEGVRDSEAKDGLASIRLAILERELLENGRRYIAETEKKRAKRPSKV